MNENENDSFFNKIKYAQFELFYNFYINLDVSKFSILISYMYQILLFQSFFFHSNVKYL